MKIDKDTKKFFSLASRPGNFGAAIYNELFRNFGINAVYLPLSISGNHTFTEAFHGLRIIGAQGINVSMPYKVEALNHVHNMPPVANINTMVRDKYGAWAGYNTDGYGFITALAEKRKPADIETAYIFGDGAVASTVMNELHNWNPEMSVSCGKRDPISEYDLFVNATPVGMPGVEPSFSWDHLVWRSDCFFDCVIPQPKVATKLVEAARDRGKTAISGDQMAMHGITKQFSYHFPGYPEVLHLVKYEMKAMGYDV